MPAVGNDLWDQARGAPCAIATAASTSSGSARSKRWAATTVEKNERAFPVLSEWALQAAIALGVAFVHRVVGARGTGHAPRRVADFVVENAAAWR
jgi:hypothetical protein